MANLEQSTAFHPFVQQLISFAAIAWLAGNHKIVRVVRSTSINRDNMIDMIRIPTSSKFLLAVVAFALLPFILILNVFSSVFPWNALHTGAMLHVVHPYLLRMGLVIFTASLSMHTTIRLCILFVILSTLWFMCFSIGLSRLQDTFPVGFIVALIVLSHTISICLIVTCSTILTLRLQAAFHTVARMKVLKGCGEKPLAFSAAFLRYNVRHGRTNLLSSAWGCYKHRSGKPFLVLPLYHKSTWEASL